MPYKTKIHRDLFIQNLDDKMKDQAFLDDVTALLIHEVDYDPRKAADFLNKKLIILIPESRTKQRKNKPSLKR